MVVAFVGCQKVIELPYRSIDPIYVIEANLVGDRGLVRISQSRDMDDPDSDSGVVDDATVIVSDDLGMEYLFTSIGDGYYSSPKTLDVENFTTYHLSVEVDDELFESTSQSYDTPSVGGVTITKESFVDGAFAMVFCSFLIYDLAGVDEYYRYRISVNDDIGNWVLISNFGTDGGVLMAYMPLIKKDLKDDLLEIESGDRVTIEVQSIDANVYEYFYTLDAGEDNGSNPTSNISGGCLGYFSVYTLITGVYTVDMDSVTLVEN